jgi:hypothetical protein
MKNLLIYVNPRESFDELNEKLIKIQIDNSLELGWDPKDIILVTNFPYEYRGIKPFIIDGGYCDFEIPATKTMTVGYLFEIDFFGEDLYWAHDLDAFQLESITEEELGLDGLDGGFNDYCRIPQWQLGSFFFRKAMKDVFIEVGKRIRPGVNDEFALVELTNENFNNINARIKKLNTTYDFGMRKIKECYEKADKPLRVVHFQPYSKLLPTLDIAMYGKNRIGKPLMNERLIKIFERYGIK